MPVLVVPAVEALELGSAFPAVQLALAAALVDSKVAELVGLEVSGRAAVGHCRAQQLAGYWQQF